MDSQSMSDSPKLGEAEFAQYVERGAGELVEIKSKDTPKSTPSSPSSAASASSPTSTSPQSPRSPKKDDTPGAIDASAPRTPPRTTPTSPVSKITSPTAATSLSAFPPKPRAALFTTMPPTAKVAQPKQSNNSAEETAAAVEATTATTTVGMPATFTAPILKPVAVAIRPMTASTKRLSFSSLSSTRRPIKYGKGKYAGVELVPQPSDDSEDPLNWSVPKKEANYWTLLLLVSLISVMKTAFISGNSQLATGYAVSYTAATALTGVPLMASALVGFVSLVASRIYGKRSVYLVSVLFLLVGTVWNTSVAHSFAQCMAARVFQGIGWGAFDVLVLSSIDDTYFEHERYVRHALYDVVVVASTWGGPLIGGVVSSHGQGFELQFVILTSFLAVGVLALVLAAPETSYDRSFYSINTPATAWSTKDLPLRPRAHTWSPEGARNYLWSKNLRPVAYKANVSRATLASLLWQAPRAMAAPTTVLLALVSLLPFCALWGMASSLSLLFSPLPFDLSSESVGILLLAPFLLATAVVAAAAYFWPAWRRRSAAAAASTSTSCSVSALAAGTLLSFIGLLVFGLYVSSCATLSASAAAAQHGSSFAIAATGTTTLKFPAVSFVLGLLAAGAYVLDATVRPMVRRSTQFTSSNLTIAQRNTNDMCAAVSLWRTLVVGAFVMALPNAVWLSDLLKATSIGIVVAQVVVAVAIAFVWWRCDETVRRLDGQIMRCVDLGILKRTGSFFDVDD
ncbi:major facilitator superfamily transporter [Ophiostoma piceae UAMH 11346]|uniref:Major facilitator superfamily transporter n=1 Tax=Ophiostoma piceae (strain UAMH 11346) TaxID=1262450 RepID=S3BYS1_OPHP1|nr:major facilitator superfamily transporter [Ophiostoma piceae UAMH 11346]